MNKIFTGIGSRENVPDIILKQLRNLSYHLCMKGWVLRSGAASGCDASFEIGAIKASGKMEIYLPWKGFNNNDSPLYNYLTIHEEIAFKYHPNLYGQKDSVIKLMIRNSAQIIGIGPSKILTDMVICYCPVINGKETGGTSQALRVARGEGNGKIPIYNLFLPDTYEEIKKIVEEL